jgi:hypothetical protein
MLLTLSSAAFSTIITSYSLPSDEYDALYELYNSTSGANWNWVSPFSTLTGYPWNFTSPEQNPCSLDYPWQGIYCSSSCGIKPCNIIEVFLPNHALRGTIPNTIGRLSNLQSLQLEFNYLTGTIPNSVGNLIALQNLI